MRVTPSPNFVKRFRKLKPDRQGRITRTLEKFLSDPMPKSLDFRGLSGAEGYYIIDVSGGDRIILRKIEDAHYEIADFGPHDIYRRWNR